MENLSCVLHIRSILSLKQMSWYFPFIIIGGAVVLHFLVGLFLGAYEAVSLVIRYDRSILCCLFYL